MVQRHLSIPHNFICFTDKPIEGFGIENHPPPCNLPGWWGKVGFFQSGLSVSYPMLYLDLDVIVTGPLDDLFVGKDFAVIHQQKIIKAPRTVPGYNSSAMLFGHAGSREQVCADFTPPVMGWFRGDQDWLRYCCPREYTWQDSWFSFMEKCKEGPPEDCRLVICNVIENSDAVRRFPWTREAWA